MTCGICFVNPIHTYMQKVGETYASGACDTCSKRYYRNGGFVNPEVDMNQIQVVIAQEKTLSDQRLDMIKQFFPQDQPGLDHAVYLVKEVKTQYKRIDEERTKITKPLREGLKALQDFFNPPLKNYAEMEKILKERIVQCQQHMRAQHDAAVQAAQQAFQQGDMTQLAQATQAIASAEASTPQGVSIRVTWGFEIEDYTKIPMQFWMINESAIQAAITAAKGQIQIPGVKVVRKEGVAVRT